MKRLAAILAFSASAWTTQARAQHAEPPTPPAPSLADAPAATIERSGLPDLSFEEAMAMARKNNRAIKVDRAQLAVAQTATDTAWSALLPTIAAQGKYTRNYAQ
ncbi:MAG TPA: TolC family protein, partial [Polyangia bacterium]|nr:TolC family protein [Polyangia bacterium]